MTLSFYFSCNIIQYIFFWRFNSINMTWSKCLVFTKSVIMWLNNISQWLFQLGVVCLPCYYMTLFNTFAQHAGLWSSGMTLASHVELSWFVTHIKLCSVCYYFIAYSVLYFCSFFRTMANISIFLSHWLSHTNFYSLFSQIIRRCKDCNACKLVILIFVYCVTKRDNSKHNRYM